MSDVASSSPEANYLTRNNIVHPMSNRPGTQGDAHVAAAEAAGRADIAARATYPSSTAITVGGGNIRKGKYPMPITYKTPDGTTVTTLAELATWLFAREGRAAPSNAEVIVHADRKPGTAIS